MPSEKNIVHDGVLWPFKSRCQKVKLCMVAHQHTTGDMDCIVHYTLYDLLVTTRQTWQNILCIQPNLHLGQDCFHRQYYNIL